MLWSSLPEILGPTTQVSVDGSGSFCGEGQSGGRGHIPQLLQVFSSNLCGQESYPRGAAVFSSRLPRGSQMSPGIRM